MRMMPKTDWSLRNRKEQAINKPTAIARRFRFH
jgi:hypothetical protein